MSTASSASAAAPIKRKRDIRLDFFRGLGMFIIFFAHMPNNWWANFIPARFGFSDATEIFVFCSGMASALAFGRLFADRGFALGLTRIAYRCWQVYWAHIALFLVVTAMMVFVDRALGTGTAYQGMVNLLPFLKQDTGQQLIGLLTLTYVPNLFDILPMYLVILALIPVMMALSRVSVWLVFAAMATLWLLAFTRTVEFPAEPWSDRVWYFNPFAWQLVFFSGFAFMRGWIPAPPVDRRLIIAAAVFVIAAIPFSHWPTVSSWPALMAVRETIWPMIEKTHYGLLRHVHFLALAYLAYVLAGPNGDNIKGPGVSIVVKVGQQALGVFMASIVLSMACGVVLDLIGRSWLTVSLINIAGCAILVGVAYTAAYFKSAPWQAARHVREAPKPAPTGTTMGERSAQSSASAPQSGLAAKA